MTPQVTKPSTTNNQKNAPLLIAKQLNKSVRVGERRLDIIKNVSLSVAAGEFVIIMGKSGSGKSTLLGLLAALDYPDSGSIELDGALLNTLDEDSLAKIRQAKMGFVFQSFHLLPTLTVSENIAFPLDITKTPDPNRVQELITAVNLNHRKHNLPAQLSGGEQQRTAVARALVARPKIVFADEPTGNLDEENAKQVLNLLLDLRKDSGSALVVVTHDPALAKLADRVIIMKDGSIEDSSLQHLQIANAAKREVAI